MSVGLSSVEISVRTDPGRDPDKQVNEDAAHYVETPLGLLALVCDGMGGHAGGKEASDLAVRTIVEIVAAAPAATSPEVALRRAVEEANARVWSMATAEDGLRPGSTVVAALFHGAGASVAHVGDSRAYLLHAGAISQLTRDHSMVEELVARNLIRPEEAANHPDSNKILRALGIARDVDVDVRPEPVAYVAGDAFVLCSDGLSDLVEPAEILEIAGSQPPGQASGQLVDLANARGGHDNITAMIVRMTTSAKPAEGAERRGDASRVAKTIPLTAHAAAPEGAGPTGTLVAGPMAGATVRPPAGEPMPAPHAPPPISAPSPRVQRPPEPPRKPMLALGLALAVVAVGIVLAIVLLSTRKPHRAVPIVESSPAPAASHVEPVETEEGPTEEQIIVPAPTLEPPPRERWRLPDGGAPDPCEAALRLRERGDTRAELIERLEARCRATSGSP